MRLLINLAVIGIVSAALILIAASPLHPDAEAFIGALFIWCGAAAAMIADLMRLFPDGLGKYADHEITDLRASLAPRLRPLLW